MTGFILRRLGALAVTLVIASLLVFAAMFLAPGDPLSLLLGDHPPTPDVVDALRAQYHLNDPFLVQYWDWLTGALHGDLGESITAQQPVAGLVGGRLTTTLMLISYAALLIMVAGVTMGVVAALRPGPVDGSIVVATTVGVASPAFVVGIVLIAVFAVQLGWFPVFGPGNGFLDRIWHLTLPAIALAVPGAALVTRITRVAVAEELTSEHAQAARARGVPERLVLRRHVARNAMIPISTAIGVTLAGLIAGSVVVEQVFGLNGLGTLLIQSVNGKDFAVVQAITLVLIVLYVLVNTMVDVLNAWLDPRLRTGALAR
jgi:peptide/nickel transport system permease protein